MTLSEAIYQLTPNHINYLLLDWDKHLDQHIKYAFDHDNFRDLIAYKELSYYKPSVIEKLVR